MTQILDRAWLLGHIDYIWNNRHKLQNRPCAEFVITGFVINSFACPYYGYAIDKITLGNLIDLWDKGFIYKGVKFNNEEGNQIYCTFYGTLHAIFYDSICSK